jgi:hypothetical protein
MHWIILALALIALYSFGMWLFTAVSDYRDKAAMRLCRDRNFEKFMAIATFRENFTYHLGLCGILCLIGIILAAK